jgi:hypothetical protein
MLYSKQKKNQNIIFISMHKKVWGKYNGNYKHKIPLSHYITCNVINLVTVFSTLYFTSLN